MDWRDKYWIDCIAEACQDCGLVATKEQVETVASWAQGAHENYGMATGGDCIPNPLHSEVERLRLELKKEQNKQICSSCMGKGTITTNGPYHSATGSCYSCNGTGWKL